LYLRALSILEKAGTQRAIWQGPSAFSRQIRDPFLHITQLFIQLTYQSRPDNDEAVLCTKQYHRMMRYHLALLKVELLKSQT
jgi:hypothetical protein